MAGQKVLAALSAAAAGTATYRYFVLGYSLLSERVLLPAAAAVLLLASLLFIRRILSLEHLLGGGRK